MLEELQPLLEELSVALKRVDISGDEDLLQRYGLKIPVLTLEGKVLCQFRLDALKVREALGSRPSH